MKKYILFLIILPCLSMQTKKYTFLHKIKSLAHLFKKTAPSPCYLAQLPVDVTNIIASYLTFTDKETDQEFVERTKKLVPLISSSRIKQKKVNYLNMLLTLQEKRNEDIKFLHDYLVQIKNIHTNEEKNCYKYTGSPHFDFFSLCPSANNRRLIALHRPHQKTYAFALDVVKDEIIFNQEYIYPFERLLLFTPIIAIAEKKPFFAFIEQSRKNPCLCIQNINEYKLYEMAFLDSYEHIFSIAFNKQETKIIVHGIAQNKEQRIKYDIFELEDTQIHNEGIKKTLKDYFRQKGICKNWPPHSTGLS